MSANVDRMRESWLNADRSNDDDDDELEPAIDTRDGSEFSEFEEAGNE